VGYAPFNPTKVLEQLRSCGIVDAAAVTRSHYRVKQPVRDFYLRYRSIAGGALPYSIPAELF
jgi:myosin heavy subunit